MDYTHESFRAAAGTAASYGLVLLATFLLLFLVPFGVFWALSP